MRKTFLLQPMMLAAMLMLFSCHKEKRSIDQNSLGLESKINLWIDKQNATSNIIKKNNIESLKLNLEFSKARFEKLGQKEQFLIVPIAEEYKKTGKFDKNSIMNLLLVVDQMGNIKRGNISEFMLESNSQIDKLPSNTFFNLYNNQDLEFDGTFRFLSVTGRWLHQFGVKNGKLSSMGIVKSKPNSSNGVASGRIGSCIVWHWVTIYYNSDGEIINETWQYIGMTCSNDQCSDPNNAMLCPDGVGGSGGGTGGEEETCCIVDPNIQFTHNQTNIINDICGLVGVNPITGNPTKTCTHTWTFDKWRLLWYNWDFTSVTKTDLEKEAGLWKFKTIAFQGVSRSGQLPPCVSSNCTATYPNASISADQLMAKLILTYTIENRVTCYPWWSPDAITSTIEKDWNPPY